MSAEEGWVEVRAYDPLWLGRFESESSAVRAALVEYAVAVEHFGSTSVPDMAAKPIVDILVGTTAAGVPENVHSALALLGYEYLGEDGRRPGRFFWRKRGQYAFNVSVVPVNGEMWNDNLALRDFLRAHSDWVQRYADVKRAAAKASPNSMLGYQEGKRAFIEEMKIAARAWVASKPAQRGLMQQ
ncbi:GrpB family protein [Subtercola endophyticus]|uniref:GrpB family protein n=1 Tax=Subtercola endophyticus TaxID=2895559 RepID=UPI001E345D6C|nr:GrpB family protein [Subtercola endophyticus]UFS58178.1 GrpB family protein [Subtercola endophyticus]